MAGNRRWIIGLIRLTIKEAEAAIAMLGPWVDFSEIFPLSFPAEPSQRHTLPSTADRAADPDPRLRSRDASEEHAAGRSILPRDSASGFASCVRPWCWGQFSDGAGMKPSWDDYPPATSRPSMTGNPQNAQSGKWKLFSILLTGAFSLPSLGAFFPWLKADLAAQVSAAYTAPDIC